LSASAQTLPIVIGYGANLLGTPFIVASLGLTSFGLWALTGAVAQYGVLLDLGVSRAIVRYVALYHAQNDREKERAIIGGCVIVIVIMGCLLMSLPLLIPAQLGHLIGTDDMSLARLLFISSIVVLITGILGAIFAGASIGRGRTVAASIGVAIQRASVVTGGIVAIIFNPTLWHFALGSATGGAIGLFVVLIAILLDEREIRIARPRMSIMRDLISFSLKGQVMSVAEIVLFQSGKLLAGIIIGPAAAGAYELGSRLALGARAFGTSASSVLSAHLTRGYALNGPEELRRDYARLVQRNAAVSNFALLFLVATSFSVVPIWLGSAHEDVVWVVIALTTAYTVNVSTGVTNAVAFAMNQLGIVTIVAIGGSLLAVALELPLAHYVGLKGILIGMVAAIIASSMGGVIVIHRANSIPWASFFSSIRGPFAVGLVSVAFAIPVGILCSPTDRASAIIPFMCSAGIFCTLYTILGWRLGYLPAVASLTGWRARRAAISLADK